MPDRSQRPPLRSRSPRRRAILPVLALVAVGACETATGPNLTLPAGFLEMDYSGSIEGTLSIAGELRLDEGVVARQEFAAAGANQYTPEDKLTVVAFLPTGGSEGIYFAITMPDAEAGTTVPLDANCFERTCGSTLLFFGVGPHRPHQDVNPDVDRACWIESGALLITERTADRIGGTFAGEGYCVYDNRTDPLTAFIVDAASFDVPISFTYQPRIDLR